MKPEQLVEHAAKAGIGLSTARLLENKVVGGYAAPVVALVLGYALSNVKNWEATAYALGGHGLFNLVKRLAVKTPGGILDAALPGNTNMGEGVFQLKIGSGAAPSPGTNGIFGLGRTRRRGMRGISSDMLDSTLRGIPSSMGTTDVDFESALVA